MAPASKGVEAACWCLLCCWSLPSFSSRIVLTRRQLHMVSSTRFYQGLYSRLSKLAYYISIARFLVKGPHHESWLASGFFVLSSRRFVLKFQGLPDRPVVGDGLIFVFVVLEDRARETGTSSSWIAFFSPPTKNDAPQKNHENASGELYTNQPLWQDNGYMSSPLRNFPWRSRCKRQYSG